MKKLLQGLCLVVLCLSSALADETFGTGANMEQLTPISNILDKPEAFLDREVTVKGTIVNVCRKRGCWMDIATDKKFQTLKVKVRDGDMVFPLTARGKTAYATGKVTALPLDLEQTKKYLAHQAKESKAEFDANAVTQGMTIYRLSPTGVTIVD